MVFALAVFLVFLMLAAQYESWGMPFSVLLGTPFAAFGAYLGLWLARLFMGESYVNNVFAQIGLIMLIGLAAKNAILIVEFAKVEHEQGKSLVDAALSAAKLRLRPILMTAFAFILGVVPLLTASGAGAEARKVMGMVVFSGMLIATILGVLLIPMLYVAVGKVIGGGDAGAGAGAGPAARWRPNTDRGATEMARLAALRRAAAGRWRSVADGRMRAVGPNYERPADADAAAVPLRRRAGAGRSRSRISPWWQVFDDPALQALVREAIANNLDLRVGRGARRGSARRAGIAKSFLYPQVDGAAGYGVRQASNTRRTTAWRERRHDAPERRRSASSCRGRSICSAASAASTRRRWRVAARDRAGPPRRARDAGRRRRDQLLPAARARPAARDRARRRSGSTTRR